MPKLTLFFIPLLVAGALAATAADKLEKNFMRPPDSARPWVYLFPLDGNISSNGITADLEAMKRVGIGGVLYMETEQGTPHGPAAFGGALWRELFKHLCSESQRLGMQVNVNNDAGWCGSGGPWITPELSMQKVVWSETVVQGPTRFDVALPQPPTVMDFYRDIAVFAFPSLPGDDVKMADAKPKITASVMNKTFDAKNLLDDDAKTFVTLPPPEMNKPSSLKLEFPQPFTARTLTLTSGWPGRQSCYGALQVSDDGKTFRDVCQFELINVPLSLNFPEVTARHFRILFTNAVASLKQVKIAGVDLSPRFCLDNLQGKSALAKMEFVPPADFPAVPAALTLARDRIVNLTKKLDKDGRLAWDVPVGKWTVLRLGHTTTGRENHPAPKGGLGLECDKLSKEAAEAAFNGLMSKVIADSKPLVGEKKTLVSTHIDSWEVGSQNWTPKFREEFQARRGYDPLPLLPVMTGRVVDSLEISERFLWDLRQTVSDLVADNYAGHFRELAHRHGIRLSIEAYDGSPTCDLTYAGRADEPMAEFWVYKGLYDWGVSCVEMASAAHVYGRRIIGAEAFTSTDAEKWQAHPAAVKALGDWAFTAGINRFVFHRYALQPWTNPDRPPGMSMGPWGLHYERTQTWWEQSKAWHEYLARCQYLLQQGLFVADICYLAAERAPQLWQPPAPEPFLEHGGFNFDGCPPEVLLTRMKVKDGKLVLPDGMSYRVLVLPDVPTMTPKLLRKVKELVAAGATVVGPRPVKSPSLTDYPKCDAEVKQLAAELWGDCDGQHVTEHAFGKGLVICGKTAEEVLTGMKVKPDFTCSGKTPEVGLRYIHRTIGDAEVYFVANKESQTTEAVCSFRVTGKQPELWWPDTGRMERAAVYEQKDGVTVLPLRFDPSGSVFVVFRKKAESGKLKAEIKNWLEFAPVQEIAGAWEVSFDPKWGGPATPVTFNTLGDWSKRSEDGIRHYSGTAVYRKTFALPNSKPKTRNQKLFLDLGQVAVMAEVKLNGKDLGTLWKPPFRVDITDAVKAGDNTLELKVVNLWINRVIGDEQLPDDSKRKPNGTLEEWPAWLNEGKPSPTGRYTFTSWRLWKKDDALVESGLLGPVTIQTAK